MSTVTIGVPDPLDAALSARMKAVGALSREEYLLKLIASDYAVDELERTLEGRLAGCLSRWKGIGARGPLAIFPQRAAGLIAVVFKTVK